MPDTEVQVSAVLCTCVPVQAPTALLDLMESTAIRSNSWLSWPLTSRFRCSMSSRITVVSNHSCQALLGTLTCYGDEN